MFKKRDPEPEPPRLQGEDFDIFPALDEEDIRRVPPEEEEISTEPAEPVEETPPEPTEFEKKIAAIPDDQWKKYQLIAGIVLGALSATCIVVLGRIESVGTIGFIIGALLALYLPNMLEKKGGRKIPLLRTALIISLVISMGLFALYGFVINPGYFAPAATPVPEASAAPAP
ncbi:MAG TPA: hypothetical protein VN366_05495 [Feifaniaceae bacterium]|nr:hypothetical protein [Feifaniaceae bacterium]